jgi:DeoR/GlpR family transcriptional regulator of sugar metabolism
MEAVRYTEAPARRAELLRRLQTDGYVSCAQLAGELGVSEMTIRRDIRQLHVDGLARRVVGGARLAEAGRVPFERRNREGTAEKRAIVAACVPLLHGAMTIALDAGTTVAPLAALIPPGTTVVSHSVPVITACAARDDVELLGLGGIYQPDTRAFAGPTTRAELESLAVDVAVLSATAVDDASVRCASLLDAEIKRAMAASARRTILLVDHAKLGARASIRIGPLSLVDTVITGAGAKPAFVDRLREAGVEVLLADASEVASIS